MIVIGLTGSIGMGKSTVADMFRAARVPVFDADATVRVLQGPGGKALAGIEAMFPGTINGDGLDRQALGGRVFGNAEALAKLERLIHPLVGVEQRAFLRNQARNELVVLDLPLLFERGGWRGVDLRVVVSAPARVQRARVLRRPGMTPAKLDAILGTQMPDAEKRARADVIVPTGLGLALTRATVRRLIACLRRGGVAQVRACVKSSSIPKRRACRRSTGTGWSRSAASRSSTRSRPDGPSTPM